ncbi:hypothetical protein IFR05_001504 [Cadophora sp. M221]|nr:hypothetical protein IFR05_001504 [Cadophora sp. M221]
MKSSKVLMDVDNIPISLFSEGAQLGTITAQATAGLVYAIIEYGMEYPLGTTANAAYDFYSTDTNTISGNATYEARVGTFLPNVDCQPAPSSPEIPLNIQRCYAAGVVCPDREQLAYLALANSSLTSATFGLEIFDVQTVYNGTNATDTLLGSQALSCNISYSLTTSTLSFKSVNGRQTNIELSHHVKGSNLTWKYVHMGDVALLLDQMKYVNFYNQDAGQSSGFFFASMTRISNLTYFDMLSDPLAFKASSELLTRMIVSQFAGQYLMNSTSRSIDGTVVLEERRLSVITVSAFLMAGNFLVVTVLTLLLIRCRSHDIVTENPESLGLISKMLQHNEDLNDQLKETGKLSETSLQVQLAGCTVQSSAELPRVMKIHSQQAQENSQTVPSELPPLWIPLIARLSVVGVVIGTPLVLIAILEILQHLSDTKSGFDSVRQSSTRTAVLTHYLPALVAFCVASLHNALDFTIVSLFPFHKFKQIKKSRTNIETTLLGLNPLHLLFTSLRNKRWPIVLSTSGALVGSLLAIITSALYEVNLVSIPTEVTMYQTTMFNGSWANDNITDHQAGLLTSLVNWANMTYPTWTHDSYAIPQITGDGGQSELLNVILPLWRPSLQCEAVQNYSLSHQEYKRLVLTVNTTLPSSCNAASPNEVITFDMSYSESQFSNTTIGKIYQFDGRRKTREVVSTNGKPSTLTNCPSIYLNFIFSPSVNETGIAHPFLCAQIIEEANATLTFQLPTFQLLEPPVIDETSRRRVKNGTEESFDFTITPDFLPVISGTYNNLFASSSSGPIWSEYIDPFFGLIFFGVDALSFSDITSPGGGEKLQEAVQVLYQRYMAQVISNNMRSPVREPVKASLQTESLRIMQRRRPKIILQAMLAFMVVCAGLAYVLMWDMRRLLYHQPYSIAGIASLLAGSSLCDPRSGEVDEGAERQWSWRHKTISLGWWNYREQPQYGIDQGLCDFVPRVRDRHRPG